MKGFFIFLFLLAPALANARGFSIEAIKINLEREIEKKLDVNNITLSQLVIKRDGSGKIFTLEQVENAKIADLLEISKLEIANNKFISTVSEISGKYNISVTGKIARSIKIPVLSENISKETEITQDLIELVDIPERTLRGTTITGIKDLLGTVAARNISKKNQISFTDIKKPTIVKKNDVVQAIYQVKNMEIKTLAVAQQEGGLNDVITLRNYDSGKMFEGRVNSEGRVTVNFEEKEIVLK
ncbi:MAG TPA: flagella basal body P-ring formation protein FlgA [Alphaproteobacteria bacterium]|nr:flagella basal body P-ring formation protein FlgA [Alphaproteobacteria bacterium]